MARLCLVSLGCMLTSVAHVRPGDHVASRRLDCFCHVRLLPAASARAAGNADGIAVYTALLASPAAIAAAAGRRRT